MKIDLDAIGLDFEQESVKRASSVIDEFTTGGNQEGSISETLGGALGEAVRTGEYNDALNSHGQNYLDTQVNSNLYGNQLTWQSPGYASDLVKYAPKHRFIFKVQFVFNEPYANRINREFMYVVKNIDKPTVEFDYEEVNMYNFKTKILKSIRHQPLNMTFHDDIQNKVLDFFDAYRTAYSPVSKMTVDGAHVMEDYGMNFHDPASGLAYSSSLGPLESDQKNLLNHIRLVQVYGHGSRENHFIFLNPKITTFDFDNVDHENSEGNALTVSFDYDSLYIENKITTGTPEPRWGQNDIAGNAPQSPRRGYDGSFGGDDTKDGLPSSKPPSTKTADGSFIEPDTNTKEVIPSSASPMTIQQAKTVSKLIPATGNDNSNVFDKAQQKLTSLLK